MKGLKQLRQLIKGRKIEEILFVCVALLALVAFAGLGVAQAKGGYYDVGFAGKHVAYVKNAKSVNVALELAKQNYNEKNGIPALRPAHEPMVQKSINMTMISEKEAPLPLKELADRFEKEVDWVVPGFAVKGLNDVTVTLADEETAEAIMNELLETAKNREHPAVVNNAVVPHPKLDSVDAELANLALIAEEQPALADTVYQVEETTLLDEASRFPIETPKSRILSKEDALAELKKGQPVLRPHIISPGEDQKMIAALYGMNEERVTELNPDLNWGNVNPGTQIQVERQEPIIRDRQVITEIKQEYMPFEVSYKDDPDMMIGQYKVETPGKAGVKTTTSRVTKVAEFEEGREVVSETYDLAPENAIVLRGTSTTPKVQWPLSGVITSPFGERTWPNAVVEFHRGLDIAAPIGTPVRVAKEGKVTFVGEMGSYGNVVFVDHGEGFSTRYAHLSKIDCQIGDVLASGDKLGEVGSTGNSTGPHLHFETLLNEEPKDPMHFLVSAKTGENKDNS